MWQVIEMPAVIVSGYLVDVTVVRGEAECTHPWPVTTKPGDNTGFVFYQLKKFWSGDASEAWRLSEENRLAARITDTPTLVAIDDFEYDQWRKMVIVAKPAIFRWVPKPLPIFQR